MMKVLFVEPPKDIWFVMGEYLPPPYGIIQLAAYLEREIDPITIQVLDCNAQQVDWRGLEKEITSFQPDIVASSALATCNTYSAVRVFETVKRVDSTILTVAGGQHFTILAQESLEQFPEIDVIVRGEGELTFTELVKKAEMRSFQHIRGISFRSPGMIQHNPPRPLIENLDELPFPGYHFVKENMPKYHFSAMAGIKAPYALIEGSRGCPHRCTFCSQWGHWSGSWRKKSPKRIADEMEWCVQRFGSRFIWLTDDNFGFGQRAIDLAHELLQKDLPDDVMWFTQARCDDVITYKTTLPLLRQTGLRWILLGVENARPATLNTFKKNIIPDDAKHAIRLLQENDIFAQAMYIIGEHEDSADSIAASRQFLDKLDPDFVIYAILTPFPGTPLYDKAQKLGWIEDTNWAHYDMIHAIMPTATLSRKEVQEELYKCYREFYGSWRRRLKGTFARNSLKRRIFWYMLRKGIISELKTLFQALK
jgi:anaerobic magnesium-protoporphyrin IX monomethyl ester cyclase